MADVPHRRTHYFPANGLHVVSIELMPGAFIAHYNEPGMPAIGRGTTMLEAIADLAVQSAGSGSACDQLTRSSCNHGAVPVSANGSPWR